ncbi:MAG: hypothetical protein ABIF09_15815 [Gemmatimonadota bacterium]
MKRSTVLTEKNRGAWATIFAVIILLPVALSLAGFVSFRVEETPEVFLEAPNPEWENCLRDAAFMRFQHMDLLKDVRTDVIRNGIKGGITLARCGDCHENRDQFCDKCHEAASVSLDCWGCHYYLTASEREELERRGE